MRSGSNNSLYNDSTMESPARNLFRNDKFGSGRKSVYSDVAYQRH